jgi:putative nucleotidyltransferase with HDIG domain
VNQALQLGLDVAVEDEFVDSIAALSTAIEFKDGSVRGHNRRVAGYAVAIGRELGMNNQAIRIMARAALLHDIGKLGISDTILLKQGPLSESEWTLVTRHPTMGLDILATVDHLQQETEIIAAHHERIDGSGYPRAWSGTRSRWARGSSRWPTRMTC